MSQQNILQSSSKPIGANEINLNEQQKLMEKMAPEIQKTLADAQMEEQEKSVLFTGMTNSEVESWLAQRYDIMDSARDSASWDLRWKQFEAKTNWNPDGTANVNLPIEKVTIRNKMADEMSQRPDIRFIPLERSDVKKLRKIKKIWDYVWVEADTDKNIFDVYQTKGCFGTAWWYEYLHRDFCKRFIPKLEDNGKITAIPVIQEKSWLRGKCLDIRDVWVDPVADIEDADDCFIRERDVSYDFLVGLKNDPNYYNIDAAIQGGVGASSPQMPFQTTQEALRSDNQSRKYTIWNYYNKRKGVYIASVGSKPGKIIIRMGVNPFPDGELPLIPAVDHRLFNSMYGEGECSLLETTKYERNVTRNQMIDYVRSSNTTALAVGKGVAYEGTDMVSGIMQIWNFDGSLSDSQVVKPPPMDSGLSVIDGIFRDDATWITGIDNNALAGSPTKTAFEARLQEVTKLKGISVSSKQMDYFFMRLGRKRLANIQFFLPKTTGKRLLNENSAEGAKPNMSKNGYRIIPLKDTTTKKITMVDDTGKATQYNDLVDSKDDWTFFELAPDEIQSQLDITVETPSTTPIMRELDKFEMQELFTKVVNAAQVYPQLLQSYDINKFLEQSIEDLGYNPDDFKFSKEDDQKKAEDMRSQVLGDVPQPMRTITQPTPDNSQMTGIKQMQDQLLMNQKS